MGFRFRKSFRFGKFFRVGVGKTGVRPTFTLPGTGLSYTPSSPKRAASPSPEPRPGAGPLDRNVSCSGGCLIFVLGMGVILWLIGQEEKEQALKLRRPPSSSARP